MYCPSFWGDVPNKARQQGEFQVPKFAHQNSQVGKKDDARRQDHLRWWRGARAWRWNKGSVERRGEEEEGYLLSNVSNAAFCIHIERF